MLVNYELVAVFNRWMTVRVTVWFGPFVTLMLMLMMRTMRVSMQVFLSFMAMLQLMQPCLGPNERRQQGKQ